MLGLSMFAQWTPASDADREWLEDDNDWGPPSSFTDDPDEAMTFVDPEDDYNDSDGLSNFVTQFYGYPLDSPGADDDAESGTDTPSYMDLPDSQSDPTLQAFQAKVAGTILACGIADFHPRKNNPGFTGGNHNVLFGTGSIDGSDRTVGIAFRWLAKRDPAPGEGAIATLRIAQERRRWDKKNILQYVALSQYLKKRGIKCPSVLAYNVDMKNTLKEPWLICELLGGDNLQNTYFTMEYQTRYQIMKEYIEVVKALERPGAPYLEPFSRVIPATSMDPDFLSHEPANLEIRPFNIATDMDGSTRHHTLDRGSNEWNHWMLNELCNEWYNNYRGEAPRLTRNVFNFLALRPRHEIHMDRLGVVRHKDLGMRNIMAHEGHITGVLDWDDTRTYLVPMARRMPEYFWDSSFVDTGLNPESNRMIEGDTFPVTENAPLRPLDYKLRHLFIRHVNNTIDPNWVTDAETAGFRSRELYQAMVRRYDTWIAKLVGVKRALLVCEAKDAKLDYDSWVAYWKANLKDSGVGQAVVDKAFPAAAEPDQRGTEALAEQLWETCAGQKNIIEEYKELTAAGISLGSE